MNNREYGIDRGPQTHEELYWTIRGLLGVKIPRTKVCENHSTPFDALAEAYFAEVPVSLWHGSRGLSGKSYTLSVLSFMEAAMLGAEITLLGGSTAQSLNVHNHTQELWDAPNAPKELLKDVPTKYETDLTNHGKLRTLTASQTSVRGPHPQRLRLDEIDEMEMSILTAAQGQPMRSRGVETQTVMCVVAETAVLTDRGEVPIVDVTSSDRVMTRQGWRPVEQMSYSGYGDTLELKLSNGHTLVCTDNHRIAVPGGWILPRDMSVGQEVCGVFTPAQKPVFVVDILAGRSRHVYDLSVEGVHEFVAERIVVHNSSTWQYPDGTMSSMMKTAEEKGFPVHSWCYRETSNPIDGWLDPEEVERKRREIPTTMWESEYDLQEPSFENRAFDPLLMEASFADNLGEFSGDRPVVIERSVPGAAYVTGVDWAKTKDLTVVATFRTDGDYWKCVSWQSFNRQPWPETVRRAWTQWREYPGIMVHDATGLGSVVDDLLREYTPDPVHKRRIKPFIISQGEKRRALFTEYIAAIERQQIVYPRIQSAYDAHRYCSGDHLFTPAGHPPDEVVAGALAWTSRMSGLVEMVAPIGMTKQSAWLG